MIDTTELNTVFSSCLYKEDEVTDGIPPDGCIKVKGIMFEYGFHPDRLELTREKVKGWLEQLPKSFHKSVGGGMSFLQACMTEAGEHWGEHPSMEQLFVLGEALGYVKLCTPREIWSALPGGLPYYVIDLS